MFEELAMEYIWQSPVMIKAINLGLLICGALIAGFTFPGRRVCRAAFFAGTALAILAMQVAQMIWFDVYLALDNGYLISLVTAELLISALAGVLLGQLAIGRSVDAFGTRRWAFLAFIPIAAFWLFFTQPKNTPAGSSNARVTVLVVMGFAAFIAGTLSNLLIRDRMGTIAAERALQAQHSTVS